MLAAKSGIMVLGYYFNLYYGGKKIQFKKVLQLIDIRDRELISIAIWEKLVSFKKNTVSTVSDTFNR